MPDKVFVAQHHPEAHLLCGMLQSEGIEAEVRKEALLSVMEASTVIPGMQPEVWILDSSQMPLALNVIERFQNQTESAETIQITWQCENCGEILESQFTDCWSCGNPKSLE